MQDKRDQSINDFIFPKNFIKELKNNENILQTLNQDIILAQHIVTKTQKNTQQQINIAQLFFNIFLTQKKVIHLNIDQTKKEIKEMIHYHENGLFQPLDYLRIILLSSYIRQKKEGISMRACEIKTNTKLHYTILIITNNKDHTENDITFNQIITLALKRTREQSKSKPKKRNPLTKSIRYEVLKKDNFKCKFCGKTKEETSLEIDHITPISRGGTDEIDNLQTLCSTCNLSKNNRIIK